MLDSMGQEISFKLQLHKWFIFSCVESLLNFQNPEHYDELKNNKLEQNFSKMAIFV